MAYREQSQEEESFWIKMAKKAGEVKSNSQPEAKKKGGLVHEIPETTVLFDADFTSEPTRDRHKYDTTEMPLEETINKRLDTQRVDTLKRNLGLGEKTSTGKESQKLVEEATQDKEHQQKIMALHQAVEAYARGEENDLELTDPDAYRIVRLHFLMVERKYQEEDKNTNWFGKMKRIWGKKTDLELQYERLRELLEKASISAKTPDYRKDAENRESRLPPGSMNTTTTR